MSQVQVVASRKRRAATIDMVVPTAVRVEAGWERTSPAWVFPNRLRIADVPLDAAHANGAAAIRNRTGVSVADAHVGALIESSPSSQSEPALRHWRAFVTFRSSISGNDVWTIPILGRAPRALTHVRRPPADGRSAITFAYALEQVLGGTWEVRVLLADGDW